MKPALYPGTAASLLHAPVAAAAMFCSEPSAPHCVDGIGTFDDEYAFDQCRAEVEAYMADVDSYVECLAQEQSETIDEANDIIERFNCKAQGNSFCS